MSLIPGFQGLSVNKSLICCPNIARNQVSNHPMIFFCFSALWPFSTLGWPDVSAEDFKQFYPTTLLETGYVPPVHYNIYQQNIWELLIFILLRRIFCRLYFG